MRSLNDIKSWFKTGKFPTESQFAEAWDSFWHKAESISVSAVEGLQKILSSKADRDLVDNQVADLRQNKENVGVARDLVEAHKAAGDAHQELFDLKANDADVYHRDILDIRFASHEEDMDLHFTEEEKLKLQHVAKFVTGVGMSTGQAGNEALNLTIDAITPDVSGDIATEALELPLATERTNGLLSPAQKSVLDHLAIGDSSLTATGTPSAVWQLSSTSGPKLKNSGNTFELRDAGDTAYTDLILNNLTIKGNVVQEGSSFITHAETVETKDNLILVNKDEVGAGVSKGTAGIEVERGTEENYCILFDESDDRFKAGKTNDLHMVALRDTDAAFTDQHFVKWDAATKTLKDGGNSAPASDVYDWAKAATKPAYSWSEINGKPSFATVATSGSYDDLSNKPTIPSLAGYATQAWVTGQGYTGNTGTVTQVKIGSTAYNPASGVISLPAYPTVPALNWGNIGDKPSFAAVATSGNYNDLSNKPTIPSLSGYATQSWVTSNYYPINGRGYWTIDSHGRPTMVNNQGPYFKKSDGTDIEAIYMDSSNQFVIGGVSSASVPVVIHNRLIAGEGISVAGDIDVGNSSASLDKCVRIATGTSKYAFTRVQSGEKFWDIAVKDTINSGALMFRPQGGSQVCVVSQYGDLTLTRNLTVGGAATFAEYVTCLGGAGLAASSDMRFKNNIQEIGPVLKDVLQAPCITYNWKEETNRVVGTSAQYWEGKIPELVSEMDDKDHTKVFFYDRLAVITQKALQEEHELRNKEREELLGVIDGLKKELNELKALMKYE